MALTIAWSLKKYRLITWFVVYTTVQVNSSSLNVLWAQGSRGSISCSQLVFTLGLYTSPHRNLGIYPFCWFSIQPCALRLCLSDLGSSLRSPLCSAMFSLDFGQESEHFCAVLKPPHLVWSDIFPTSCLSTVKHYVSFWFLASCRVSICLKCILSKANGLWSSVVFYTLDEACVPLRALTGPVHQSIKSLLNLDEFQIWMRIGSALALQNEIFSARLSEVTVALLLIWRLLGQQFFWSALHF